VLVYTQCKNDFHNDSKCRKKPTLCTCYNNTTKLHVSVAAAVICTILGLRIGLINELIRCKKNSLLTAALDQLRVVASSTSNDPGPRSRQHQQIGQRLLPLAAANFSVDDPAGASSQQQKETHSKILPSPTYMEITKNSIGLSRNKGLRICGTLRLAALGYRVYLTLYNCGFL